MVNVQMKNEKGFTLIEMMIAAAMSVVLLGATIYTYNKQDKLLRSENKNIHLRDHGRLAMDELAPLIRLAGAGFPPGDFAAPRPSSGVAVADATTITFLANTEGVSTTSKLDTVTTSNGFLVPAGDAVGIFTVGNRVVFFDTKDPTLTGIQTIGSVSNVNADYDRILWSSGNNGVAFTPITGGTAVVINEFHIYTLAYNAGNQQITQATDGAAAVAIANKISNLTFSYFDADGDPLTSLPLNATDRGNVRRVQVDITIMDDLETSETVRLITDINMRNMGT